MSAQSTPTTYTPKEERNIQIVKEYMFLTYSPQRASGDAVKHLCASSNKFVAPTTFPGINTCEAYADDHAKLMKSITDLHIVSCDTLFAHGDHVCMHYTAEGSHLGAPHNDIAATGRKATWTATVIFRLEEFKIVELTKDWNKLSMWEQFGWPVDECYSYKGSFSEKMTDAVDSVRTSLAEFLRPDNTVGDKVDDAKTAVADTIRPEDKPWHQKVGEKIEEARASIAHKLQPEGPRPISEATKKEEAAKKVEDAKKEADKKVEDAKEPTLGQKISESVANAKASLADSIAPDSSVISRRLADVRQGVAYALKPDDKMTFSDKANMAVDGAVFKATGFAAKKADEAEEAKKVEEDKKKADEAKKAAQEATAASSSIRPYVAEEKPVTERIGEAFSELGTTISDGATKAAEALNLKSDPLAPVKPTGIAVPVHRDSHASSQL